MSLRIILLFVIAAAQALATAASATPVAYSFSTDLISPFGGSTPVTVPLNAEATALAEQLSGSSVSGSFIYDAATLQTGTLTSPPGASIYVGSLTDLSATVAGGSIGIGYGISDPLGFTVVGNDVLPGGSDYLQLQADPFSAIGTHNIAGFIFGDYYLWNVRMFWIEGQLTPDLVPDFLSNQDLLSPLPGIPGRLALDFKRFGDTSDSQFHLFYDGLTVTQAVSIPEPNVPALLLIGLAGLGFFCKKAPPKRGS